MPRSKSKRDSYTPPPKPRPKPSPQWVPYVGTGLILLGIAVILLSYLVDGGLPGGYFWIIGGFVFMAGGLGVLSQWR